MAAQPCDNEDEAIWGSINKSADRSSRDVVFLLYCAAWKAMPRALWLFFGSSVKKTAHILETLLQKVKKVIKGTGLYKG